MPEVKDMGIKLFGKTIASPPANNQAPSGGGGGGGDHEQLKQLSDHNLVSSTTSSSPRVGDGQQIQKKPSESEHKELKAPSNGENPRTPSFDKEQINNDDQSENSISPEEKTLKKPDKILPCPRCSSMDTKFCYYNNYNVSQPRHFCKNCQRYWTAGGSMRNVPVGSGRRKNNNKSSFPTSQYHRHIMVSEATNGSVLTFGSDSQRVSVSCGGKENGGEEFSASDSAEKGGNSCLQEKKCHNFQAQIPCFPVPPWISPWNSPQWQSTIPLAFYQTPPYWGGCNLPGPWSVPWFSPQIPNSSTLGKRSRDGEMVNKPLNSEKQDFASKENDSERGVWIPKTLRMDDPREAAKSSVWSTLGFKSFQSKGNEKNHVTDTSLVLQANPAALCRSLNFHESA